MIKKKCNVCLIEKELNEYNKSKTNKFGVKTICKECSSKKSKLLYKNNKDKILKKQKDYISKNLKECRERSRK